MTQRADTSAPEIEDLLRQLAGRSDRVQSVRATTTLHILAMTEWSARIVSICVATLTGIVLALTLATGAERTARANTAIAEGTSRLAKTDRLFSRHDPAPVQIQAPTPPVATDTRPGARFAFIRGGIDDAILAEMPAKQPMATPPAAQTHRKPHRVRKASSKPAARAAAAASPRQPWLLDVIVRHLARGS